jgi:hypothetical protein
MSENLRIVEEYMEDQKPIPVETSSDRDAGSTLTFIFFVFIIITSGLIGLKLGETFNWKLANGTEPGAFTGFIVGFIVSLFFKPIRRMLAILLVLGIAGAAIYYLYSWLLA